MVYCWIPQWISFQDGSIQLDVSRWVIYLTYLILYLHVIVSPFYASTVATSPSSSPLSASSGMIYSSEFASSPPFTGSPDSLMSGFASAPIYQAPPLVQSSSTSTMSSTGSAYLNETIAKASALPESFYPEFLQYSKESFEQNTRKPCFNKKRLREEDSVKDDGDKRSRKQKPE